MNHVTGITVEHFLNSYGEQLKLERVTGDVGLHRLIKEGTVNRPALALTGFFKYFANKRIQVLGAAEMTYLRTLNADEQEGIFREMAKRHVPCFILSRSYKPTRSMLKVCQETKLPLLRTPMITKHLLNLLTISIDNEFAPSTSEHATTLDIKGIGVLLRGDSGVGKSECALALIERGYSLVADDLTQISLVDERELVATSNELNRGYMECRGIGIINVAEMFGVKNVRVDKRIDLVVSLREWSPDADEERTGLEENFYEILGIKVPHVELYVRPGRDMARIVEVAALIQALKLTGHDPAKEFNDRLIAHMAEKKDVKRAKGRIMRLD